MGGGWRVDFGLKRCIFLVIFTSYRAFKTTNKTSDNSGQWGNKK